MVPMCTRREAVLEDGFAEDSCDIHDRGLRGIMHCTDNHNPLGTNENGRNDSFISPQISDSSQFEPLCPSLYADARSSTRPTLAPARVHRKNFAKTLPAASIATPAHTPLTMTGNIEG